MHTGISVTMLRGVMELKQTETLRRGTEVREIAEPPRVGGALVENPLKGSVLEEEREHVKKLSLRKPVRLSALSKTTERGWPVQAGGGQSCPEVPCDVLEAKTGVPRPGGSTGYSGCLFRS